VSPAEILHEDFEKALSEIDFSKAYDPYSKAFMKPLFIGMLLTAIRMTEDDVEEELEGAEGYYETYLETGDTEYRGMANDELRHAGILIKKHLAKTPDAEKRERLNALEKKRQDMMKMIASKQEA
jgi:hypothetical protein